MAQKLQEQLRAELESILGDMATGDIRTDYMRFRAMQGAEINVSEQRVGQIVDLVERAFPAGPERDRVLNFQSHPEYQPFLDDLEQRQEVQEEADAVIDSTIAAAQRREAGEEGTQSTDTDTETEATTDTDFPSDSTEAAAMRDPRFGEDVDAEEAAADSAQDLVDSAGGGTGGGVGTSAPPTGEITDPMYVGIPPGGELWRINEGLIAVAYQIEEGDPESGWVYYGFRTQEDLNRAFPGKLPEVKDLTQEEVDRLGGVHIASTALLRSGDDALTEGWQEGFYTAIERQTKLQPWLEDPEVLSVILTATLEGRQITRSDLESTDWFASRNEREVDYVVRVASSNQEDLDQYHQQFRDQVDDLMQAAGIRNPDPLLTEFVSRRWASGDWTEAYTTTQIGALANPFSDTPLDTELAEVADSTEIESLSMQAEAIKDLVRQWLGPHRVDMFQDEWYREQAGAILEDPNAEQDLVDYLQGQRLALYPEYENAALRYADIAPVWENLLQQQWGRVPANADERAIVDRLIRTNDTSEAQKILRREGLDRGVGKVTNEVLTAMGRGFGSQVAPGGA